MRRSRRGARLRALRSLASLLIGVLLALLPAARAGATWSIVAVDAATREVGVAGASCILGAEVLARLVPGHGAVAAQAIPNLPGRDALARSIAAGASPAQALAEVASSDFDHALGLPSSRLRQYGVAALGDFAPASHTGTWTIGWAGARSGRGVTVQGNMLRGPEVVEHALAAFEAQTPGCTRTLADRLVGALSAGAAAGGDRRCNPDLAALSAFLFVAKPGDDAAKPSIALVRNRPGALPSPWNDLTRTLLISEERGGAAENPVLLLRAAYEAERGSGCR